MGPWQWDFVTPDLERPEIPYATVTLPSCGSDPGNLGDLADDAREVETSITSIDGDVIVVAHSYAGVVVTETDYLRTPGPWTTLALSCPKLDTRLHPTCRHETSRHSFMYVQIGTTNFEKAHIPTILCNECTEQRIRWLNERIQLHSVGVVVTPVSRASWTMTTSTYVILTNDQIIPVELQRISHRDRYTG